MAGNVAEWVSDVYRPIIDSEQNDLNYYRGKFVKILMRTMRYLCTILQISSLTPSNGKFYQKIFQVA